MADAKTTGLTALSSGGSASGDLLMLVDVSDTTMHANGTNKKMTLDNFFANLPVGIGWGDEEISEYDEGTWTPVLVGNSTAGSHTYTTQVGTYIRFGTVAQVTFEIVISSKDAAMSGNIRVNGLPFVCASGLSFYAGSVSRLKNVDFGDAPVCHARTGLSFLEWRRSESSTSTGSGFMTDAHVGTAPEFYASVWYRI